MRGRHRRDDGEVLELFGPREALVFGTSGSNISGVAPQCKSARKPAKNADVQMQRFVDCAKLLLVAACGGIEIFRDAKKRIAPHRTQRAVA